MDDIYHQIMKEWYWLVIMAALVAVAFAPTFLKSKCPRCGKKKLISVDLDQLVREKLESANGNRLFLTFFRCENCLARVFRERTGPFEDASAAEWELAFQEHHDSALVP